MTLVDHAKARERSNELSLGDLVKRATGQISDLVHKEMRLAQLELAQKGKRVGIAVGLFGGAGVFVFYGVGVFLAAAVLGLSNVFTPWLAALIIGGGLFLVAAIAALIGVGQLKKAKPPIPTHAVNGFKADVATIKERARR